MWVYTTHDSHVTLSIYRSQSCDSQWMDATFSYHRKIIKIIHFLATKCPRSFRHLGPGYRVQPLWDWSRRYTKFLPPLPGPRAVAPGYRGGRGGGKGEPVPGGPSQLCCGELETQLHHDSNSTCTWWHIVQLNWILYYHTICSCMVAMYIMVLILSKSNLVLGSPWQHRYDVMITYMHPQPSAWPQTWWQCNIITTW